MKFEDRRKNLFSSTLNKDRYGFKNDPCISIRLHKPEIQITGRLSIFKVSRCSATRVRIQHVISQRPTNNYFNSFIAKQETYSRIQTQALSIFRRLKTRMSNFLHGRSERSLRLSIQKISSLTRGKNEYKLAGIIIFNECGLRFNE